MRGQKKMKTDQLFELLKQNPEFMREAETRIEKKIVRLIAEDVKKMEPGEAERYKDKIFQAVYLGEQAGFETGLSWGIQLTAESRLISES